MAQNISRNIVDKNPVYINRWLTGLMTQRSPLFVPLTAMGVQMVNMYDSLWDGQNCEISSTMTVQRRPGFSRFCSQAFGTTEYPLGWYTFRNLSGTVYPLVDTATKVYLTSSSTLTTAYSKTSTLPMSFRGVGDALYMCNGMDAVKWNGTTSSKWGIDAPLTAPTITPQAGNLSPTRGYKWGYCFKNSSTGHVSTMSPASANVGKGTNQSYALSGERSIDPQVDKIEIYRIADGGSLFYYVATINNPVAGSWTYSDNKADNTLNDDIIAPLAHLNDPPPDGVSLVTMHGGRLWVAADNCVYFSSGPDVTNGVPEECFAPANVFKFPRKVTALTSISIGLVVWTDDDCYIIVGSSLATFYSQLWQANFGVANKNCVVQDGDNMFVFTTRSQLFYVGSGGLQEVGYNIRAKLATFDPAKVSLALHRSGIDEGLFVSDGTANMYRYSVALQTWSPVSKPVGGVGVVGSIETSAAKYQLLIGRPTGSGYILVRDTNSFSDDGTGYSAFVTVGSLVLSAPGQTATIESVMIETMPVGTYPTIGVLLNEVSGTFVTLPNPVPDPPMLAASTTIRTKRHYLKAAQTPLAQTVRHLQVKVDFGTDTAKQELLGMAVG